MATISDPETPEAPIDEDEHANAELPMTMAASVVLEHLPKDAHKALETAGELEQAKGMPITTPSKPLAAINCRYQREARMYISLSPMLTTPVTVRFSPLPSTPKLRQPRFKCTSSQSFETVVRFLRRKLKVKDHESVFCYVNSVFAPGLDEGVGNLWRVSVVGR